MKTVSVDDDAYVLLRTAKHGPHESFSDVVKRLLGPKRQIEGSAGGWSDMDDAEAETLRATTLHGFADGG